MKISLVGKDVNFLNGLQARLNLEGFHVEVNRPYSDKIQLVHWLKRALPDFLILEMGEPYYEGLEVVQKTKQEDDLKYLPVFVFSLLPQEELRDKTLSYGADFFFLKEELDLDTFVVSFKRIINNKFKNN